MKKMKVVYVDPNTGKNNFAVLDNQDKIVEYAGFKSTLFEAFKKNYEGVKMSSSMVNIPGVGDVQKSSIKGFIEDKKGSFVVRNSDKFGRTRFETDPPDKKTWKALCVGMNEVYPHLRILSVTAYTGVMKGMWNLDNEMTDECVRLGTVKIECS